MVRARNNQTTKTNKSNGKRGATKGQTRNRREADLGTLLPAPRDLVRRVRDEVDRLFQDFGFDHLTRSLPDNLTRSLPDNLARSLPDVEAIGLGKWAPEIEVFDRAGEVIVRADLPGLTKDDIKIDLTERAITIEGERKQEHKENENGYYRSERSYGHFYRRIPLPDGVNIETATAQFADGVLELSFAAPEHREVKARKLEINGRVVAKAKAAGR